MLTKPIAVLLMAGTALAGCQSMGAGELGGTLIGAGAGAGIAAALGGNDTTIVLAALAGAFIGNQIGEALDEESRRRAMQAQYQALEYGQSSQQVGWQNPDQGTYGYVTPQPVYVVNNSNCRDYTHTIYIDGVPQTARGTACRNADGTWTPVG